MSMIEIPGIGPDEPEEVPQLIDLSKLANELWEADPECDHNIVLAPGGGIKCTKCRGWCCV